MRSVKDADDPTTASPVTESAAASAQESGEGLDNYDAAIWHTLDIVQRLTRGDLHERGSAEVSFEPVYGEGEIILVTGEFELFEQVHANSWVTIDYGVLAVSTAGFYFETEASVNPWDFASIIGAEIMEPGKVCVTGESQRGPVTWLVVSPWAELLFVMWARTQDPHHPQLATHDWIPDGWMDRVNDAGFAPSLATGALPVVAKQSHYEVLEVSPNASSALISAAYRVKAKQAHPDRGGSAEEMALVNEAFRVLSDVHLRMAYDAGEDF